MNKNAWPVRAVAVATAAYSIAITVSPRILAQPCGLLNSDGSVPPEVTGLTRSVGTRDAAMALALALAPAGRQVSLLTAARVVSDGADALWFGRMATPSQRAKIAGVAAGWAALELAVALLSNRGQAGE